MCHTGQPARLPQYMSHQPELLTHVVVMSFCLVLSPCLIVEGACFCFGSAVLDGVKGGAWAGKVAVCFAFCMSPIAHTHTVPTPPGEASGGMGREGSPRAQQQAGTSGGAW